MAKRSTFNEKDIKYFETALGLQPLEISDLHAIFWKAGINKAKNTFFTQRQKDYLFKQIYHDYMLRDELRNYVIGYKKEKKQPIENIIEAKTKKATKIIKTSMRKRLNEDSNGEYGRVLNPPFEIKNPQEELTYERIVKLLDEYYGYFYEEVYDYENYHYLSNSTPSTIEDIELTFDVTYNNIPCILSIITNCENCKYDTDYNEYHTLNSFDFVPTYVELTTDRNNGYKEIYSCDFERNETWINGQEVDNNKQTTNMKLTENKLNQIVKSSIKKVLNEGQSDGNLIEKWNYWCVNYNHDFIEKAWSDNPIMVAHLKSKFDHYYDMEGRYGVMNKFYLNLDEENRRILENYVINNY